MCVEELNLSRPLAQYDSINNRQVVNRLTQEFKAHLPVKRVKRTNTGRPSIKAIRLINNYNTVRRTGTKAQRQCALRTIIGAALPSILWPLKMQIRNRSAR